MLTSEEIQIIVDLVAKRLKDKGGDIAQINLSPTYAEAVELAKKIKIHSDINGSPSSLLIKKYPNETQEELDYRLSSFEPITPSYWSKAQGTTNRIWNKQNYSITHDEQSKEYFEKEFPVYGNIEMFFISIMSVQKINDPNAVLAVKPYRYLYDQEGKANLTERIEPFPYIYTCDKVINFEENEYCLLASNEKSEVYVYEQQGLSNKRKLEESGLVFYMYDDMKIYRIAQYGKKTDYKFEWDIDYNHDLEYMPAWQLQGIPVFCENGALFHSYFMPAIPQLNLATTLHSTLDGVLAKQAYPIRAYYTEPCTNQECEGGIINVYDDDEPGKILKKMTCPTCKGTGKSMAFSPFNDYMVNITDERFSGDNKIDFPGIKFVAPETTLYEWMHKIIYDSIERAFSFVNIDVSNSKVQPTKDQPALKSRIDEEGLQSFLTIFAHENFDISGKTIKACGQMRFGKTEYKQASISEPHEFSIKNASDLTTEYAEAEKNNLPVFAKQAIFNSYIKQRFGTDTVAIRVNNIASLADPYLTFSNEDVLARFAGGTIDEWQVILHDNVYNYMMNHIESEKEYLAKDDLIIVKELRDQAKKDADELSVAIESSTQAILDAAKPKPINEPAPAE